jgi:uncharacterized protein (TIGR02246 family)
MAVVLLAAGARMQAATSDENAVRAVVTQEVEAWKKHDAKGVSSLYTVDAVWQNPFGVRLKSSAALEKFLVRLFQRPGYLAAKETSEPAITDLHFAAPTVAVVWSEESSKGQIDDATGKPMQPRHSYYLEVLVKQAGGWKISECMIMDEIPR